MPKLLSYEISQALMTILLNFVKQLDQKKEDESIQIFLLLDALLEKEYCFFSQFIPAFLDAFIELYPKLNVDQQIIIS